MPGKTILRLIALIGIGTAAFVGAEYRKQSTALSRIHTSQLQITAQLKKPTLTEKKRQSLQTRRSLLQRLQKQSKKKQKLFIIISAVAAVIGLISGVMSLRARE